MPIRMMFHTTRNSTRTKITFSGFEHESQKVLLLSLIFCRLLTLKCVGGGGGSCMQSESFAHLHSGAVGAEVVQSWRLQLQSAL